MPLPRRTLLTAALCSSAALTLPGCSLVSDPDAIATPTSDVPVPYEDEPAAELAVTSLWQAPSDSVVVSAYGSTLLGERVLVIGQNAKHGRAFTVLNLSDGSVVWTDDDLPDEIPGETDALKVQNDDVVAVDDGKDGLIVQRYWLGPCPGNADRCPTDTTTRSSGYGMVAFSAADASVRWTAEVEPPVPDGQERWTDGSLQVRAVDANASVVLITVNGGGEGNWVPDPEDEFATVALAADSGEQLWRREGVVAMGIRGVVGLGWLASDSVGPVLSGFDLENGEELWQLPLAGREIDGHQEHPEFVVLFGEGDDDATRPYELVRLNDGQVVATTTGRMVLSPSIDSRLLWQVSPEAEPKLLSRRLDEKEVSVGEVALPPGTEFLVAGVGEYVWISPEDGDCVAVDRTGAVRSTPLPSSYFHILNDELLLISGSESRPTELLSVVAG